MLRSSSLTQVVKLKLVQFAFSHAVKADKQLILKLKISNASLTDTKVSLIFDADTYVENFLRSKNGLPRGRHLG